MPTAEQCTDKAMIDLGDGRTGTACWYPQMGGYGGRCVVVVDSNDREDPCFEAYVWHDGEFPFEEGTPRCLHHCSAQQFIEFGQFVAGLTKADEDFTAKVARIAREVLGEELEPYRGINRGIVMGIDWRSADRLIAQIAEHIAQVVARETA